LAEIGQREAVIALAGNHDADLSHGVMLRIIERFSADAEAREALLMRSSLPAPLRADLVAATAKALSGFVAACNWMSPERAERVTCEASEQGAISVAIATPREEMPDLVRHLRHSAGLTVALLLRGLLCGNRALFEFTLAELSGLSFARIGGLVREPRSAGFAALYRKTGLPDHFLGVFRAALLALDETQVRPGDELSTALIERVIEACEESGSPDLHKMVSLLRRFEADAARCEARAFAVARRSAPLLVRLDAGPLENELSVAPALIAIQGPSAFEAEAPPIELPLDLIAALSEAA
jgi:uncharacterized protein (DUF2336 family)